MDNSAINSNIGRRITVASNKATIRWEGSIDGKPWFGVEWDDPERGKHDGTHKGTRYFTCINKNAGHKSGSFVNPVKVTFGQSFLEAIRSQYQSNEGDGTLGVEVFVGGGKKIEFVGEKKAAEIMGTIDSLRAVNLRGSVLAIAGKDDITKECGQILDLDMSCTLLCKWIELLNIVNQLPNLTILNIMGNPMEPLLVESESVEGSVSPSLISHAFGNLSTIVLSETGTSWSSIVIMAKELPKLTELHTCCNSISTLTPEGIIRDIKKLPTEKECIDPCLFPSLELLNLQDNRLSWFEIWRLSLLPKLEKLIVSGNIITEISIIGSFEEADPGKYFGKLSSISLSENKISSWTSVQEMHKLHSLEKIRIARNPVTSLYRGSSDGAVSGAPSMVGSPGRESVTSKPDTAPPSPAVVDRDRRQNESDEERDREMPITAMSAPARLETIARLGRLTGLNGGNILARERLDAERLYLRQCVAKLLSDTVYQLLDEKEQDEATQNRLPNPSPVFTSMHPRYVKLLAAHGVPAMGSSDDNTENTLAANIVALTLVCNSPEASTNERFSKKFPATMTVAKLRMMAARLYGLDAGKVAVYYRDGPAAPFPESMDNDFLELSHYAVKDGGEIIVEPGQ